MLYWIWFVSLFLICIALSIRWNGDEEPRVGFYIILQIFNLVLTWNVHCGAVYSFLDSNIPNPDEVIHSVTCYFLVSVFFILLFSLPAILGAVFESIYDFLSNRHEINSNSTSSNTIEFADQQPSQPDNKSNTRKLVI